MRERVDYVMCKLQKSSLEAHNQAMGSLHDWFKNFISSKEELNVKRDQEMSKLYISDTPIYMDASRIITASVHSENPDIRWLTTLKIHADVPILEKLKNDSEQEKENKELKKELLEQRLMYVELQRKMFSQQEEAKVREEALVKGYNDLKESMDKQSERTNNMMQEMLEMTKKQAQP